MKIIIFADYTSKEFNKDFNYANLLIEKGHNVLLVTNEVQLMSAVNYYDILLYGYSYIGQPLKIDIPNMLVGEYMRNNID